MANFATASAALTAALTTVDARLTNIDVNEQLELYLELINRRALIQQAIASSGGGSSSIALSQAQFVETQLTAPSSTPARSMAGYSKAFIQVVIASISTNVVIRVEGSNDGTSWGNLNSTNSDTTLTANGVQTFSFVGCPQFIRTTFVSETGAASVTVNVITRLSA